MAPSENAKVNSDAPRDGLVFEKMSSVQALCSPNLQGVVLRTQTCRTLFELRNGNLGHLQNALRHGPEVKGFITQGVGIRKVGVIDGWNCLRGVSFRGNYHGSFHGDHVSEFHSFRGHFRRVIRHHVVKVSLRDVGMTNFSR